MNVEHEPSGTLVVGIGNADRGDDGFGVAVARRLREATILTAKVIERSGDILALIDDWVGYEAVILADAAAGNGPPGTIHRIDLARDEMPRDLSLGSTHALGVAEAVALARALDQLPRRLIVYAVEAAGFDYGAALSAPVAATIPVVVGRILGDIAILNAARPQEAADA